MHVWICCAPILIIKVKWSLKWLIGRSKCLNRAIKGSEELTRAHWGSIRLKMENMGLPRLNKDQNGSRKSFLSTFSNENRLFGRSLRLDSTWSTHGLGRFAMDFTWITSIFSPVVLHQTVYSLNHYKLNDWNLMMMMVIYDHLN